MTDDLKLPSKPDPNLIQAAGDSVLYNARAYAGMLTTSSDRILRTRGGGDLYLYEQVLSDPQVKSTFEQRRNAVIARDWKVDAGGDRRIDKQAADFLRQQIEKVGWDALTDKMLYGVFYGYSVAELIWEVDDGKWGWKAIKARMRRKFRFTHDGELRLFTPEDPANGMPAEAPYFWHFATGADNDDLPYGIGLAHWCYWPALFKRQDITFWLTFLDKFASPTAIGKFPPGSDQGTINKLLSALAAIRTDSGIAIPEGMMVELLEAARSGTADYKTLHDTMDASIAKAVIGQTASTAGTPGRLGNEHLQSEVRMDIVKADSDLVCESFNLGPVRWLMHYNFPTAALPRIYRVIQEPEDANTLADRDTKVRALGFKPSLQYVQQTYGSHWTEDLTQPAKPGDGTPALPAPSEFAEPAQLAIRRADAQQKLDDLLAGADRFDARWREFVEPRVKELQVVLDQASSLEEFHQQVIAFAEDDPNDALVTALARAGFAAQLLGRTGG